MGTSKRATHYIQDEEERRRVDHRLGQSVSLYSDMTDEEFNRRVGDYMGTVRSMQGISQAEAVKGGWISKNHLSSVERGVNGISLRAFIKFCDVVGMTPDEVLKIETVGRGRGLKKKIENNNAQTTQEDVKDYAFESNMNAPGYSTKDIEEILSSIAMLLTMEPTERKYANRMLVAMNDDNEGVQTDTMKRLLAYTSALSEITSKGGTEDVNKQTEENGSMAAKALRGVKELDTYESKHDFDILGTATFKVENRDGALVLVNTETGTVVQTVGRATDSGVNLEPGTSVTLKEYFEKRA